MIENDVTDGSCIPKKGGEDWPRLLHIFCLDYMLRRWQLRGESENSERVSGADAAAVAGGRCAQVDRTTHQHEPRVHQTRMFPAALHSLTFLCLQTKH